MKLLFLFCIFYFCFKSESAHIRCQVEQYFDGTKCSPCDSLCQKCEGSSDNCLECKPRKFLMQQQRSNKNKFSCLEDCNFDESRIEGKTYYSCKRDSKENSLNKQCPEGSFLNRDRNLCKLCHPLCATCADEGVADCTSCKPTEFQIADNNNENLDTFECTKICKTDSTSISQKSYKLCGSSSKMRRLSSSSSIDEAQPIRDSPVSPGFSFDWLHVICIVLLSNLAVIVAAFLYFRFRKKRQLFTMHSRMSQFELTQMEPEEEVQIVTKNQIEFGENRQLIGRGAFGKVYKCTYTDSEGRKIHAAVKVIDPQYNDAAHERRRIYDEFRNMMIPRHPYVIHLLGINMADDLMLIMPLRKGCLKRYLACSKAPIPVNRLSRFCTQIADGMMHLHSHNVFHCDLKAANVLIKDEFHIEISDFGLACPSVDDKGRYRGGTYTHMAIELLVPLKPKVFTQECDIWSFGITVWEIYNLGRCSPYEAEGKTMHTLSEFLESGGRLKKPELLKADIWANILQCFAKNSKVRPKFDRLFRTFTQLANDKTPIDDETNTRIFK